MSGMDPALFHAVFGGTHVLMEVKTHSCYPNLGKAKRGGGVSCELVSNEYVARKKGVRISGCLGEVNGGTPLIRDPGRETGNWLLPCFSSL